MDDKTTINVKAVNLKSWEAAKRAASRSGETLGQWVSRACDQLAEREAGERIYPPLIPQGGPPFLSAISDNPAANPNYPTGAPPLDLAAVADLILALRSADIPVQRRVGREAQALLHAELCRAQGKRVGKARRAIPAIPHDDNG